MKRIIYSILIVQLVFPLSIFAQINKDKITFKEYKPGYYQNYILKDISEVKEKQEPTKTKKSLKLDVTGKDYPTKVELYKQIWHNQPISQGNAGTCWDFSTSSFYEAEVFRQTKQQVKLSEIFTAYWEYVEKARRFVQERGNSHFGEGSEANAVTRMYKMYGVVPESVYDGLKDGRKFHTHEAMFKEMESFLKSVKANNAWNEDEVISTIKSIMNHYIGEPPTEFDYNGKKITPKQYLKDVLKLNMDDYVEILSILEKPYWQKVEYEVEDNWWHSADYYNIPLDDYMTLLKKAIRSGYTVSIGGDVSEAGMVTDIQVAVVPDFDIPSANIDENARQFRFSNGTTTDDHGMHLVGYLEKDGKDWYLIKDSSAGSRNNDTKSKEFGYYFFSEDFVKLKMMNFTVHKDAAKDILSKFK